MDRTSFSYPPVGIIAYSDFYGVPPVRCWGDYWLKQNLSNEFLRSGYPVDHQRPLILIHLFGEPVRELPADAYKILWIHSHPDWIGPDILGQYQKIFCVSDSFAARVRSMGFEAEHLMIPTKMRPVTAEKVYDVVFVGNTRQKKMRKIIADLGSPPWSVKIWGWGWKGLIPEHWYGGEYHDNSTLNELYAAARIVLNDHHEDMRREGFINPRILDVLASGGFVISDRVKGIEEMFGHGVPTYRSPEELKELIGKYLGDEEQRISLGRKGQEIALRFTYEDACDRIIQHIKSIFDRVSL